GRDSRQHPELAPAATSSPANDGGQELTMFFSLVRNELEKTWRSRWIVFAVVGGIFILIAGGLYTYYVFSQHRWSPPPAVAWQ
ncbi:MAG TPA: hypothetical protein DCK96_15575, partial [Chloroflexi bacterium]|nr:hypothetical protein [Chloroflexota bacterium]